MRRKWKNVTPARLLAGVHFDFRESIVVRKWIPAQNHAGMTTLFLYVLCALCACLAPMRQYSSQVLALGDRSRISEAQLDRPLHHLHST